MKKEKKDFVYYTFKGIEYGCKLILPAIIFLGIKSMKNNPMPLN